MGAPVRQIVRAVTGGGGSSASAPPAASVPASPPMAQAEAPAPADTAVAPSPAQPMAAQLGSSMLRTRRSGRSGTMLAGSDAPVVGTKRLLGE